MLTTPGSGRALLRRYMATLRAQARANGGRLRDGDVARHVFNVSGAAFSSWQNEQTDDRPSAANQRVMAMWSGGFIPESSWDTTEERERMLLAEQRGREVLLAALGPVDTTVAHAVLAGRPANAAAATGSP